MNHRLLRKLHAMLGSDNPHEAETARTKIKELLAEAGKTWNDLETILAESPDDDACCDACSADPDREMRSLDLIHETLKTYLHLPSEHGYVAIALWILHTHIYDRFAITPRLVLESPVRGCGKTTALSIIKRLSANPWKADHVTPAVLYRTIDSRRPTVLLDEVDNLGLADNGVIKAVFNSGHRHDGMVPRCQGQGTWDFSTFAPMTLAMIGKLPTPLLSRCIVVRMERNPTANLLPFDELSTEQVEACGTLWGDVLCWSHHAKINLNPPIPAGLRNRAADNWRVLLAIADSFGPEWGDRARKAALALSHAVRDEEDPGVIALADIRTVFNRYRTDRRASAALVDDLCDLPDNRWAE